MSMGVRGGVLVCMVVEVGNISHRGNCLSKWNTNEAWYKAVCDKMSVGQKVTDQESEE